MTTPDKRPLLLLTTPDKRGTTMPAREPAHVA